MASATLPNSYVLFTAYGIRSTYVSKEICTVTSSSQVLMEPYFSINKPPNAEPTAFQSSAFSKFIDFLGFSTCGLGVNVVEDIPTNTVNLADSTLLSFASVSTPSDTSSESANYSNTLASTAPGINPNTPILPSRTFDGPSSGINTGAKVAIGAFIPVIGIASLSFVTIYLWRKRRRAQSTKSNKNTSDSLDDTQPYLQQKAELDSEERRQLELDAQELRYEMDGAVEMYELEGSGDSHEVAAERRRQGRCMRR